MRVMILGSGAIGCFLTARLAAAGHDLTLAARESTRRAIESTGLVLQDQAENLRVYPRVVDGTEAGIAQAGGHDLVIVAVKAYDTESAGALLTKVNAPAVLCVQNGVGNEETLVAHLPDHRVIAGTLTTPVEVIAPGHVRVARPSYRFDIAPGPTGGDVTSIVDVFAQAGFQTRTWQDYRALKWSKLLMNILANAQAAILAYTPAQIFANPDFGNLEIRAWREALAVMAAQGIRPLALGGYPLHLVGPLVRHLPLTLVRPLLGRVIAGGRGGKMPSLYYDVYPAPRSRSEIGWLNGAIVSAGRTAGIPTPVNAAFTDILSAIVTGKAQPEDWAGHPQRLIDAVAANGSD
ncbi:MAG: ketopantoate reductase family protein [Caldilineales bacterium]|nr:ketopantoate reductase family protein [Caldilineales bacterium]